MSSVATRESVDSRVLDQLIDLPTPRELIKLARFPRKGSFRELLHVAFEALQFSPPLYLQSIFGPVRTWLAPRREHSELAVVDPRQTRRALRYLIAVSVPSVPREAPDPLRRRMPPALHGLFWRPTEIFEQPDPHGVGAFPGERWFYVNGVATDDAVARMNSTLLAELFHRPLTVIRNATSSLGLDLVECAVGKEYATDPDLSDRCTFTEPALKATLALLAALNDPQVERVVLIAHSQGTIIAANVLRAIIRALGEKRSYPQGAAAREPAHAAAESLTRQAADQRMLGLRQELVSALVSFLDTEEHALNRVKKLEIYTFANCADKMKYAFRENGQGYPRMEHFANERDLVARLGILAPCRQDPQCDLIEIDGPLYEKKGRGWLKDGAWGHLLNEHHLFDVADYLRGAESGMKNPYPAADSADPDLPRLYGYFDGGRPD